MILPNTAALVDDGCILIFRWYLFIADSELGISAFHYCEVVFIDRLKSVYPYSLIDYSM